MKNKIIILALFLCVILSGCSMNYESESIEFRGRTDWTFDNSYVYAPKGYFVNGYEWLDVDEHTKQLVITFSDNKAFGER